ncbi:MAG: tetratricopeptide repeat protein [bacterium]|nr:tetratricopeptide repeat protein [bacterium]
MFRKESKSELSRQASSEVSQYTQGMLSYRRGDYQSAVKLLDSVSKRPGPLGSMALYYAAMSNRALGIAAMRTSDFAQAERHLSAAVHAIGNSANLTEYLSACYARCQKFDKCASEMEKATESNGGPSEWRKLAQAQWRAGMKNRAMMSLYKAMRLFGDDHQLHLQLGLFHACEERYDDAFKHISASVQDDCDNATGHYYLGLTAAAQGDSVQALRCLQRSFDLEPDNLLVARQLSMAADAVHQSGVRFVLNLPEAPSDQESTPARQLARYITRDTEFSEALLRLPESEIDNDLFGVLAKVLEIALEDHDEYADLHYYASRTHDRLGDIGQAVDHAREALKINPKYVLARMQMADLCERSEQTDQAIEHITCAIDCGADWPDVHLHAANMLSRCRQNEQAKNHLFRALELKPDYRQAHEAMSLLAA